MKLDSGRDGVSLSPTTHTDITFATVDLANFNVYSCTVLAFSDYCILQLEFLKREWRDALVAVNLKFFLFQLGSQKGVTLLERYPYILLKIFQLDVPVAHRFVQS